MRPPARPTHGGASPFGTGRGRGARGRARPGRRTRLLGLLVAAGLVVAGCGERARLDSDAGTTALTVVASTTVPAAQRVQFRPVQQVVPAAGTCRPEPVPDPAAAQVLPRCRGSLTSESYGLGPAFLLGDAVEAAEPVLEPGSWSVRLTLREGPAGIDTFNDWATRCFEGRPECPDTGTGAGSIAIVFDGRVLTAATVQAPSFARDLISVRLDDEATARALAAALGPAPS